MKKRSYKKEINEINAILVKSPTLKEALSFDEFDEMPYEGEEEMSMEPDCPEAPMGGGCNPEGEELVNTIRKMALEGMSKLADCTEDPCYDVLKRVWQTCDKVIADKKNPQQMNK